jgi:hypothetical protein
VIEGALGESPKVSALGIVVVPAFVVIDRSTAPPVIELGLVKVRLVPESVSFQDDTAIEPTETAETPTKKLPFTLTVAPPVFGITLLSVLVAVGVCTNEADQASVTVLLASSSCRSPCFPSPIT